MGWNTDESVREDKQYLQVKFNIHPTEEWTKCEGFYSLSDTKRVVILLQVRWLIMWVILSQTIYKVKFLLFLACF